MANPMPTNAYHQGSLTSLPLDIVLRIAKNLDPISAIRLHSTCREFRQDIVLHQIQIPQCLFCNKIVCSFDHIIDIIAFDLRPIRSFQGNKAVFYKLRTQKLGDMEVYIKVARIQWGFDYIYKVIYYHGCKELFQVEYVRNEEFGFPEILINDNNTSSLVPIPLALICIGVLFIARITGFNSYDIARTGRFTGDHVEYEWFWKLMDYSVCGARNTRKLYKAVIYSFYYHNNTTQ